MATEQKKVLEAKRRHEDMILSMQHTLQDAAKVQRNSHFENYNHEKDREA